MVINSKKGVYSVLYLVLVFCNMAGILILMEVELVGMLLLVVYVGAVAILFLFVVMMLGERFSLQEEEGEGKGSGILIIGLCMLFVLLGLELAENSLTSNISKDWVSVLDGVNNVKLMGMGLYGMYMLSVLIGGLVLLVGMLGAIILVV